MKTGAGLLMIANGAFFLLWRRSTLRRLDGAFYEPLIIPAAIVEFLCGFCLLLGAIALFLDWRMRWRIALTTNLVALGGVLLGIAALAHGAGPRTASNDLYHRMMLILIIAVILLLFFGRSRLKETTKILAETLWQ
jgi:hypothetical protein